MIFSSAATVRLGFKLHLEERAFIGNWALSQEPMNAARLRIFEGQIIEPDEPRGCWLIEASILNASSGRLRNRAANSVFGIRNTALGKGVAGMKTCITCTLPAALTRLTLITPAAQRRSPHTARFRGRCDASQTGDRAADSDADAPRAAVRGVRKTCGKSIEQKDSSQKELTVDGKNAAPRKRPQSPVSYRWVVAFGLRSDAKLRQLAGM